TSDRGGEPVGCQEVKECGHSRNPYVPKQDVFWPVTDPGAVKPRSRLRISRRPAAMITFPPGARRPPAPHPPGGGQGAARGAVGGGRTNARTPTPAPSTGPR